MTYRVKKVYTSQSPPGRGVVLAQEPPPLPPVPDSIITDPTADEWVLFNAAYPGTVTVTTDAQGNRTVSRP